MFSKKSHKKHEIRLLKHTNRSFLEGTVCKMVLQKQKTSPMEGNNVFTLVFRFSIPTIAGLLSTALYNLADAWFVSQLGTDAGAAVGVAFPIQTLMQTVGFTLGLGGGSLLSRKLGEKKEKEAKSYAAIAFWFSLFIGTLIAIAGVVSDAKGCGI